MVLREILTRFVDRALHPLVVVLILPILFCLSSSVVIFMKNSYIYEHLETFILNFFNTKFMIVIWIRGGQLLVTNSLDEQTNTEENHGAKWSLSLFLWSGLKTVFLSFLRTGTLSILNTDFPSLVSPLSQCFSTTGRGPVVGPGINYTGPREALLEFVIFIF
jgi:hypothetical protein